MNNQAMVALLLLLVVTGLQLCCCQHAVKIEKTVHDRRNFCVVEIGPKIH